MKNLFLEMFDIEHIKKCIEMEREFCNSSGEPGLVIICPHYSINIQSKDYYRYNEQSEQIDWDWEEMEDKIGESMEVNDYDDLCVMVYPDNYED